MTAALERPHGYARYKLDGCRCYVCGWDVSVRGAAKQAAVKAGTWAPYTPAGPVRAHVARLQRMGLAEDTIAALAGVGHTTVSELLHGRAGRTVERVYTRTATLLLAATLDLAAMPPTAMLAGIGTARRIQALCRIGWTYTVQARHAGWTSGRYASLPARTRVTATNALAVRTVYDALSMTPAPNGRWVPRTRRLAEAAGWPPPLAWDDDTIDDPAARPRGVPTTKD